MAYLKMKFFHEMQEEEDYAWDQRDIEEEIEFHFPFYFKINS